MSLSRENVPRIETDPSTVQSEVGLVCSYKYWNIDEKNDNNPSSSKPNMYKTASEIEDERYNQLSCWQRLVEFYRHDSLLIDVGVSICFAWVWPEFGSIYLMPGVTAHWVAVIIIFFLAGLSLCISDLRESSKDYFFNAFVGFYNFIGVSTFVYYTGQELFKFEVFTDGLFHGIIICSCLPMTTNMSLVLTQASGGDESSALFNATFWNFIGIFFTPLLIYYYLSDSSTINFGELYFKICLRVVAPVVVGLLLRYNISVMQDVMIEERARVKKIRESCLVFIIYTTFCETFRIEVGIDYGDFIVMVWFQVLELTFLMLMAWILLRLFFPKQYQKRVFGLYGCTHKSVALGIPLLTAIYGRDSNLGLYTLPLLVWYPTQLIFGTFMAPRLNQFVKYKESKEKSTSIQLSPMSDICTASKVEPVLAKEDREEL
mmetsp:Transcript_25141/g.58112  ORF Transcript_25141/g.58112 Transcript_25141/m.58112 type:complete len:431 (-) Transcript_25141:257-1549(-)